MATVIDSLVLELGIDPAKFTSGQKSAVEALRKFESQAVTSGKNIEAQGAKINEVFTVLKRQALELTAVFLGGKGIQEFTQYVTNLDAATGRAARTLDMSTRELSAWQSAAEQTGGSAAGMTASMQGTTQALNMFLLTGQGSFLPVLNRLGIGLFNQNRQLKTAGALYLDLAKAMEGVDPARARAFLSLVPGLNEDSINLILRGRAAVEQYLSAARAAGGTTEASAAAAAEYQRQLALLERSLTSIGRTILGAFLPALNAAASGIANLINQMRSGELGSQRASGFEKKLTPFESLIKGFIGTVIGPKSAAQFESQQLAPTAGAGKTSQGPSSSGDQEAYIRSAAEARGIDPNIAVQVARTEGLGGAYIGDRGSSFGPFQLHYGGVAGGGMAVSGLGDEFSRKTGLDARDPSTWKAQVDFALDYAKGHGWGAWHGWKGLPFAGVNPGIGAGASASSVVNSGGNTTNTASTSIGSITIHTEGGTADSIAGGIGAALRQQNFAAPWNMGQQ